jgi:hypothetical protein
VAEPLEAEAHNVHAASMHFVLRWEKVLLVLTCKYVPWDIPTHVTYGVMNSAWARIKIFLATSAMVAMLFWQEAAIRQGRLDRDGGRFIICFSSVIGMYSIAILPWQSAKSARAVSFQLPYFLPQLITCMIAVTIFT